LALVGASGVLLYLLVFRETLITVESVERIVGLPVVASVAERPAEMRIALGTDVFRARPMPRI
jgi:hypothetical protein